MTLATESTHPPASPGFPGYGELQAPSTWGELLRICREDYVANDCNWSRAGLRALVVHRFGNFRMHVGRPWRLPLSFIYMRLFLRVRNHYGIEIPYTARIGRHVVIEHQHGIVIHGASVIGDGCILRQGVTLGNRRLDRPLEAPVLGQRVNVGAGAKILGGVHVGDGASIGANAVVVDDVPAGVTVVGIPARPLPRHTAPSG